MDKSQTKKEMRIYGTYRKHVGNPIGRETTNTPNARSDGDGVNILVLQEYYDKQKLLKKLGIYMPTISGHPHTFLQTARA
jgi:hypothetical protein